MKKWVTHLSEAVGIPTKNTFFIGHSAGVITILRYLEQLPRNAKVGGCVFVAGWIDDLGYKELRNFFVKPINWAKIRQRCNKFVAIHSDNDPYVKLYHGEAFKKYLGAKLIIERSKGHMTDEEGIRKLPSVITAIKNF
jgi:predicted alpha/beta hydrolase family esterase